jgi:hypothetical protein
MSELPMRGHFRYLRFKTFPMTSRTPRCEVFCLLLSSSEHSGVPEDSQPPTFPSVGLHPHTWPKWGCDNHPKGFKGQINSYLEWKDQKGSKGVFIWAFPTFFGRKKPKGYVLNLCRFSHMKNECPNKGKTFTFKSLISSTRECLSWPRIFWDTLGNVMS